MDHTSRSARLLAVGDLQLGDSATCPGFGFRSRVSDQALADALHRFAGLLGPADILFGNLETPLSDEGLVPASRRSRQLRGDPSYAQVLRTAGFTVLNVANNHALEHAPGAFQDSVARLESAGIEACGRSGEDGWAADPVVQVVNGLRIGWLGYSLRPEPRDLDDLPYARVDEGAILADVARLKESTDSVIVSLHWGEEFVRSPSDSEVAFAHKVIDAGATIIIGHHPHVARPVERYRDALIAYSMGNFAGDMVWHSPLRRGLVLDCRLTAESVDQVSIYATRVDDSYFPRVDTHAGVPLSGSIDGLGEADYTRLARDTVRAQRRALYAYTLRNAWRFRPRVLLELAATTLYGKVARLAGGSRDTIWG